MSRTVEDGDVEAVVALVHELAEYERAAQHCHLTAAQLRAALFGPAPALFGHVAEVDGVVVGCALWFLNFSTWRGVHGLYLEDLYVQPAHRGAGLGRALLRAAGRGVRRAGARPAGVGRPGLERAVDRVLPRARRRRDGRVDGVPARRRRARRARPEA